MRRILVVFLLCVVGDLIASILTDRFVMTDQVYIAMLGLDPASPDVDRVLATIRRWSLVLLALGPLVLLIRAGAAALLVQLLLLGLGTRRPLVPIFTASLWAQLVLVLGRLARAVGLVQSAPQARINATLTEPILGVGSVLPLPEAWAPGLGWVEGISLLSVAWCFVFIAALRADRESRALARVGSVVGAALIIGGIRWIGWLYLARLGGPTPGP